MRKTVRWFAEEMEKVLKENDNRKGSYGWSNLEDSHLFSKLLEEIAELYYAIEYDPSQIIKEACDVANYAMMLADNSVENN